MNLKLDHKEIKGLLDSTVAKMERTTTDRLQTARQQALRHQRTTTSGWESRNGVLHGHLHLSQRALNWIFAAIVASALAISLTNWDNLYEHDHSEIDIAILTDELPVDMYVD
jgi:hypothetical protein